jgi:hypothetical protein
MISAESVAEIFKLQSIASIAIIDDAFNAASSLSPTEAQSLFDQFAGTPDIEKAFQDLGLPLQGPEHVTHDSIAALTAAKENEGAVLAIALVKAAGKGRKEKLGKLAASLKKLGVRVSSIPAERASKAKKDPVASDVNVVLLDYDLGDADAGATLSRSIAGKIYDQFRDAERPPLVILMSSKPLTDEDVATFQKGTKVLSGMFYFVPKDDLFDEERCNYRLAAFARSLITGQTLQVFVSKVEAALDAARERTFKDVRSLSISDFTYLKMLRLHEDGEPLGEYLMWLMSAHLLNYLSASPDVQASQAKLNELQFDHLPPTQAEPSPNLAMLYSSAVMRNMAELPTDPKEQSGSLQFGDLFQADNKVWLCITAPCDLAFGPTRPKDKKRSIVLLPGKLVPIDEEMSAFKRRLPRTELVWRDGKVFRILWSPKEVEISAWGKVGEWQTKNKSKRVARLHTPFALEIQRLFAADLTRIGMPVPPPLYAPQMVKLTCIDEYGAEIELTSEKSRTALSVGGERGVKLILGEGFMNDVPAMFAKARATLSAGLAAHQARGEEGLAGAAEVAEAIKKLDAARDSATMIGNLRGPFKMPEPGAAESILEGAIFLCDHVDVGDAKAWTPLRLAVIPPPEIAEAGEDQAA